MPLTVILSLFGTLAAAVIAGGVALHVKHLDRRYAAEQNHADARDKAYEEFLSACDRIWHLRIKWCVDAYKNPDQLVSEEKIVEISKIVGERVVSSIEELKRHARNFERASPILERLYFLASEQDPPKVAEFETSRAALQEIVRAESGLGKKMGFSRKIPSLQELKARREERKILRGTATFSVILGPKGEEVTFHSGDGEAIVYMVKKNAHEWDILTDSVALQEVRSTRWKKMGLWPE